MAAAGRWPLTGTPRASAALPGAGTGTGLGVEIDGGAELAARVLLDRLLRAPRMQVFPLRCPRWGEPMRRIAFVTDSGSITRILAYLGEPTKAPHIAPAARGPPWEEDFDTREGDTFALSEPLPEVDFDQRVSW